MFTNIFSRKYSSGCKFPLWIALTLIVAVVSYVAGESAVAPQQTDEQPISKVPTDPPVVHLVDNRRLRLDLEVDEHAYADFTPEQLGGNIEANLTYLNVSNVSIDVDGKCLNLEDAIRDEIISVDEIVAYARLDHRNGFCKEETQTDHSLTSFIYRYPKFDLRVVYDIYKSPDGTEHLIKDFEICDNAYNFTTFYSNDDGTSLNEEDWGLILESVAATSTSVTLRCTQSGGQQIGELVTGIYWLSTDGESVPYVPELRGVPRAEQNEPHITIPRNSVSEVTIDWTEIYGELPRGTYTMELRIRDVFDIAQVHPLMEDFQTAKVYVIEIKIR